MREDGPADPTHVVESHESSQKALLVRIVSGEHRFPDPSRELVEDLYVLHGYGFVQEVNVQADHMESAGGYYLAAALPTEEGETVAKRWMSAR
ncbi:MAG: hypothetical protein ACTHQQ_02915 [Solirubrobacteraceae bacterium]